MIQTERRDELLYLAGFFDGEGSIGLYYRSKVCTSGPVLIIGISNTYPWSLQRYQRAFGGTVCNLAAATVRRRRAWQWKQASAAGEKTLRELLPYLGEKRLQAEVGLEYQAWRRTQPQKSFDRVMADGFIERLKRLKHIPYTSADGTMATPEGDKPRTTI